MESTKEQVLSFLDKCEELKSCKFIMATTKIKDILKCIVNSPDLYGLFKEVTSEFDYPYAKSQCLVTVSDGNYRRSYLSMPQTVGQRLAFVFCLLVEFDKNTLNFNDFLQKYFPEDGSFYASYHAFCDIVIKGLQDAVVQVYKDVIDEALNERTETVEEVTDSPDEREEAVSVINLLISEEMQYISTSPNVPEEEREGGKAILYQLLEAVKQNNEPLINALVCGYNYFVLYNGCVSDGIEPLISKIAEYEHKL